MTAAGRPRWSGRYSATLTALVLARDGHVCRYCGQVATTADHVIPRSAGGSDGLDNLVAACRPCNLSKGTRPRPTSARPAPPSRTW